jgi:hypothetical protein
LHFSAACIPTSTRSLIGRITVTLSARLQGSARTPFDGKSLTYIDAKKFSLGGPFIFLANFGYLAVKISNKGVPFKCFCILDNWIFKSYPSLCLISPLFIFGHWTNSTLNCQKTIGPLGDFRMREFEVWFEQFLRLGKVSFGWFLSGYVKSFRSCWVLKDFLGDFCFPWAEFDNFKSTISSSSKQEN